MPSRWSRFAPPAIGILASLAIFALSLGSYCLHYFPYEDDFSLIRYSARQNSPQPVTWMTQGFSQYFANDPHCSTANFGFDRPIANATYYLESLFYRSAQGPLLLATNILCWIISAWLVYGIARRLGAWRWIASAAILLYALSPCWYRDLIHSAFRNNGVAACFVLAAWYVLLEDEAVRSWLRLLAAGILVALAAGAHEQALTSLPVLAVAIAWLSFNAEGGWRFGRIAAAIAVIAAPSLLLVACFHLMNPAYGASYVSTGFMDTLSHSRHLDALGIHSALLVKAIKLAFRIVVALFGAMSALTPLGADNMAKLSPLAGAVIFLLALVAGVAVLRRAPRQLLPLGVFLLYAIGRSIGIPSAEPRFMHMEVAWGIVMLACALSAGLASGNRAAIIPGVAAGLGLLAFNIVSYNATIVKRHSILLSRDEVDRAAFDRLRSAAAKFPAAHVILVNDQEGMWSARAMLELAGFTSGNFEILPTVGNFPSTDVLRNVSACPVDTQISPRTSYLQVHLDYPAGCTVSTFGRDLACDARDYRAAGRPQAAAWAAFLDHVTNQWLLPPPLIDEVPVQPDKPLVVIAWRDRLSAPYVNALGSESELPLETQVTR